MIKKEVKYLNYDDVEVVENILFHFSLSGLKNYEAFTGSNFFDDYAEAFHEVLKLLKNLNIQSLPKAEDLVNNNELLQTLLGLLANSTVNKFIVNYVCSFYAKRKDGKFVQNFETIEEASDSLWLLEFLNIDFFLEVFGELSKNNFASKKIQSLTKTL